MALISNKEKISIDLIMDLNIPFKIYFLLFLLIIIYVIFKYFFSSEEIFDFIEQARKNFFLNEESKLNLLTKLNTKINRDHLDNSKYYNEIGYTKIYGNKKENEKEIIDNNKSNHLEEKNKNKIFIKKRKKVGFSNNIIYENEITNE